MSPSTSTDSFPERGARARYGFPDDAFTVGGRLLELYEDDALELGRVTQVTAGVSMPGAFNGQLFDLLA